MPQLTPTELSSLVKTLAQAVGFDLVGITRPEPSAHQDEYRHWIAAHKHGEMHYLENNLEERLDPQKKFPWAKSIICVALAYWQQEPEEAPPNTQYPLPNTPSARIARYAWGRDYHKVMDAKLAALEKQLRAHLNNSELPTLSSELIFRSYADTGPLLERELAAHAGLGWIAKNTLLVHPRHGSFFVLGELVTNLDIAPDSAIPDHCGTCQRCIEACPTNAITPYSLDATRCISYLTLEHPSEIPESLHPALRSANFLAGCDICQDVCPFNRSPLPTHEPDFAPKAPAPQLSLQQILDWAEQDWDRLTRGRAFRRAKFPMWQRTAKILAT